MKIRLLIVCSSWFFYSTALMASEVQFVKETIGNNLVADKEFVVYIPNSLMPEKSTADFTQATIFLTPYDSVVEDAFILRQYTDQLVSVLSDAEKYYPASKIYGLKMNGKFYRSVMSSAYEFFFCEKMLTGNMSLYSHQKISQKYGLKQINTDNGYSTWLILDGKKKPKSVPKEYYDYYLTLKTDTNAFIRVINLIEFSEKYLADTPETFRKATQIKRKNVYEAGKNILYGSLCLSVCVIAGFQSDYRWLSLSAIPATIIFSSVTYKKIPDLTDMVALVESYNRETASR